MRETPKFMIQVEHLRDFEFKVRFDWEGVSELLLDEPEPLGHQKGPNAARMVAAAVGNCLSASLMFCLQKAKVNVGGMRAEVHGYHVRNERGRLRLGGCRVRIHVDGVAEQRARMKRCLEIFEDYCVVSDSIRKGIPVDVEVVDETGEVLTKSAED